MYMITNVDVRNPGYLFSGLKTCKQNEWFVNIIYVTGQ